MIGFLGNSCGKVKAWYLPFDFVFCRVSVNNVLRTRIVRNSSTKNIYGLPVVLLGGKVLQIYTPPNKACTRLETGAANADSESKPAVSSG